MDDGTDRTWAVREMPTAERTMALEAAKRAKLSVGLWLAQAIRAYIAQERDGTEGQGTVMAMPSPQDWDRVIALHAVLAERSGQKFTDRWALEIARKLSAQIGLETEHKPFTRARPRVNKALRLMGPGNV
jgi:hypothetical protein